MHKFLSYNKFIICHYIFRALCAHHQKVKIVLYSIWYHHIITPVGGRPVHRLRALNLCTGRSPTVVMITDAV